MLQSQSRERKHSNSKTMHKNCKQNFKFCLSDTIMLEHRSE